MAVNLPLDEMSVEDKLQLLEAIWADLSGTPDQLESPAWHQDLLEETVRRVQSGEAGLGFANRDQFMAWRREMIRSWAIAHQNEW
jgi:Putative addiction module component